MGMVEFFGVETIHASFFLCFDGDMAVADAGHFDRNGQLIWRRNRLHVGHIHARHGLGGCGRAEEDSGCQERHTQEGCREARSAHEGHGTRAHDGSWSKN